MSEFNVRDDTHAGPARDQPPRAPGWVKAFGIVLIALILAFVALKVTGVGGQHGPKRHLAPERETPASDVTDHRPPPGMGHGR